MQALSYNGSDETVVGYYELDAQMKLEPKDDPETMQFIDEKFAIPENVITLEASSVLILADQGRRWRLPLGDDAFAGLTEGAALRRARAGATGRDRLRCMRTCCG